MTENPELEHQKKLAIIEARKQAFEKSPFWFTVWDSVNSILQLCFWIGFFLILAQCNCECII